MAKTYQAICDAAAAYAEKTVDAAGFITPTIIEKFVNDGIASVWDVVNRAMGVEFFSKEDTLAVTSGTSRYQLAADFYQMLSAKVVRGSQTYFVDKWTLAEEPHLDRMTQDDGNVRYRIVGTTITTDARPFVELLPEPRQSFSFVYRYIPTPPSSTYGGGATLDLGHPKAIEAVELEAGIAILDLEQADSRALQNRLGRAIGQLEVMGESRDRARPAKIQDTRRDGGRMVPFYYGRS